VKYPLALSCMCVLRIRTRSPCWDTNTATKCACTPEHPQWLNMAYTPITAWGHACMSSYTSKDNELIIRMNLLRYWLQNKSPELD
jgi:hypothetical protein